MEQETRGEIERTSSPYPSNRPEILLGSKAAAAVTCVPEPENGIDELLALENGVADTTTLKFGGNDQPQRSSSSDPCDGDATSCIADADLKSGELMHGSLVEATMSKQELKFKELMLQ